MGSGEWVMNPVVEHSPIRSYRDLHVWNEGMALAEACYRLTRDFPRAEQYGLTSQIRRSASSIPANIAEGNGRENTGSYIHSLRIAQGSLKELETHLLLACRLGLVESVALHLVQCERLGKMLRTLIRTLERKRSD